MNRPPADRSLYLRLMRFARPYWGHITGIFLISLLSTPLALLSPLPLKIAIDSVLGSHPIPGFLNALIPGDAGSKTALLLFVVGLVLAIAVISECQAVGSALLHTYTGEKLVMDFRARLFRHVQRLSLSYHDAKGTSDATYRIQYDTYAVQYIAIDGVIPFITASFTLVSMFYITFLIDWQLALVALAVSPVLFLVARAYRGQLREKAREVKEIESEALSVVQEVLTSLRVVKAFGQEDREQQRYIHHSSEGIRARIRYTLAESGLGLILSLATAAGTAAVLFIGISHVQAGSLTLGNLLLVMGYLGQLYGPLRTISRKIASIQSHLASAERAFELLDEEPEVFERPNARPIARARGSVEFCDVSFGYNTRQPVLRNISFEVPAGTRAGIAGKTGAGKTSLINLLTRFYDPTAGRILLDGTDLRDYQLADLRNQFAIVLQEPVLFSTSIAENIAYACPNAPEEDIEEAARAANIHTFITGLPEGYQTPVGERGMLLSGGERQRIALARAFLKNAPILILDEPTSSVDMKTETGIMEAMERLMQNRTTFLIAHRLTTLESCDVLLVIQNGELLEVKSNVSSTIKDAMTAGGLE